MIKNSKVKTRFLPVILEISKIREKSEEKIDQENPRIVREYVREYVNFSSRS